MQIDRVLVTGDFIRCDESRVPHQLRNAVWMYDAVRECLLESTGIEPSLWFVHDNIEKEADTRELRLPMEYFTALGVEPSFMGWAESYFSQAEDKVVDLFADHFRSSLIVTIEMSPLIQSILDRLGVPWIEPEDVAPVVVFLASDAARMVSGATYDVTGGDSAHNTA